MACDQSMYPPVVQPASSIISFDRTLSPADRFSEKPEGDPHALWTRPKEKASPRRVDTELWTSVKANQQISRIPGNLKVLGLSEYHHSEYDKSNHRSKSSGSGRSRSNRTVSNIYSFSETTGVQNQMESLSRPQPLQVESRQLSGSSTEAQLMQSNNLTHQNLTLEKTTQLALSSLQKDHGLTYVLRRTDSNSTFQSLDGLNSAYPLIRKEAKKRKQKQKQQLGSGSKGEQGTKGSSRSVPSKTNPPPNYAMQTFQCFVSPCLGADDRVVSIGKEKSRRPRSELVTRDKLLQLKSELNEMRRMASRNCHMSTPEASNASHAKKVKFANPVVTLVNYRPYTEECDIPLLYFQEEELDELEWDREMDSGDQFECFIDARGLAISVAHRVAAHE